jgi:hypothetical protein
MTEAGSAAAEIPARVRDGVVMAHCFADGLVLTAAGEKGATALRLRRPPMRM